MPTIKKLIIIELRDATGCLRTFCITDEIRYVSCTLLYYKTRSTEPLVIAPYSQLKYCVIADDCHIHDGWTIEQQQLEGPRGCLSSSPFVARTAEQGELRWLMLIKTCFCPGTFLFTRPFLYQAAYHLLTAGNVLVYVFEEAGRVGLARKLDVFGLARKLDVLV